MIYRCAWCGKETSPEDGIMPVGVVSHGICEDCRCLFFPPLPVSLPPAGHLRRAMERTGYVN